MVKRKDSERKIKRLIVADDRVTNNDGDATAHCRCDRSGRNDFAVPGTWVPIDRWFRMHGDLYACRSSLQVF